MFNMDSSSVYRINCIQFKGSEMSGHETVLLL